MLSHFMSSSMNRYARVQLEEMSDGRFNDLLLQLITRKISEDVPVLDGIEDLFTIVSFRPRLRSDDRLREICSLFIKIPGEALQGSKREPPAAEAVCGRPVDLQHCVAQRVAQSFAATWQRPARVLHQGPHIGEVLDGKPNAAGQGVGVQWVVAAWAASEALA